MLNNTNAAWPVKPLSEVVDLIHASISLAIETISKYLSCLWLRLRLVVDGWKISDEALLYG